MSTVPTATRLVEAAERVVAAHGYQAASVKAISAEAGVATGALYRHYPSKGALFAEVFRAVSDRELAALERAIAHHDDPVDGLLAGLATFAERALRAPRLARALLDEPVDAPVDAERLAYRRRHRAVLAERIEVAVRRGALPDQDPEITAAGLVGAWAEVLVGPLAEQPTEAEGRIRALIDLAARTVGAPPPSRTPSLPPTPEETP